MVERRLAAVLAADVVGFSRLMEGDETGTLAAVKTNLQNVIEPNIAQRNGRIVKLMGDGVLAEFASVVDAVDCAVAIQNAMQDDKATSLTLRIGINLGDVIIDGEDIYGDGVNIAARLEALAEPGCVCISDMVHQSVRAKTDASFEDLGEQKLKNIDQPVRAWQWVGPERANAGLKQAKALALPEKPSIAVLPFDNMSSDPEQEYFTDGISEDIITELSKFKSLFVIARNSSFAFKGKANDVKEVSEKLGVRYVVEGSVRRAGKRVRITAQLIDAVDDTHLWADRFDRDMEDIFAVQDEVVGAIVQTIEPQLLSSERQRALRKPPENLDAWENHQRGMWHVYHYTREDAEKGLGFFERAIELDPTFASAHAGLAFGHYTHTLMGGGDRELHLAAGVKAANTAIRIDASDPFGYVALGRTQILRGEPEAGIAAFDAAIALNPSYSTAHFGRAHGLWHAGRAAEALASHDEAMRLSPQDPMFWAYMASKAIALVILERHEEALDYAQGAQRFPNATIWACLPEISALAWLDRLDEAADAIDRMSKFKDDVTINFVNVTLPVMHEPSRDHFIDGLRKAGVPE